MAARGFSTSHEPSIAQGSPTALMTVREVTYSHDLSLPARGTPSLAPAPVCHRGSWILAAHAAFTFEQDVELSFR
jgi:hypothetical protein